VRRLPQDEYFEARFTEAFANRYAYHTGDRHQVVAVFRQDLMDVVFRHSTLLLLPLAYMDGDNSKHVDAWRNKLRTVAKMKTGEAALENKEAGIAPGLSC